MGENKIINGCYYQQSEKKLGSSRPWSIKTEEEED
jgi:hypothetical protein